MADVVSVTSCLHIFFSFSLIQVWLSNFSFSDNLFKISLYQCYSCLLKLFFKIKKQSFERGQEKLMISGRDLVIDFIILCFRSEINYLQQLCKLVY